MMYADCINGGSTVVAKVRRLTGGYIEWNCPGCETAHLIPVEGTNAWAWNGDSDRPTIAPSVLVHSHPTSRVDKIPYDGGEPLSVEYKTVTPRCHSFIRDGKLMFMADSTHRLSGHTVEIPEWPASE